MQLSSTGAGGPGIRRPASSSNREASPGPVSYASVSILLPRREMSPSVFLPAALRRLGALRPLLAVADGLQPIGRDAQLDEKIFGGTGAAIAQPEVIFGGAALVAMALHHDRGAGELGQNGLQSAGIAGESVAGVGSDIALIVVEETILEAAARLPTTWWKRWSFLPGRWPSGYK
jgi:hypothetical protein